MKNDSLVAGIVTKDNYLAEKDFVFLRDIIVSKEFAWFFNSTIVEETEPKLSPGQFVHTAYIDNAPNSQLFYSLVPILDQLEIFSLLRIKINLRLRVSEPFYSHFHTDIQNEGLDEDIAAQWTTSIFYINTNNGYTEFKDGTIVESVANRLVSFPSTIKHRGVSQTDEQTRIVMNFNYLKPKGIS